MSKPSALLVLAAVIPSLVACVREPVSVAQGTPVIPIATPSAASEEPEEPEGEGEPGAPGVTGMGEIHVGQSIAEVRRILGRETRSVTEDGEREAWQSAGYDPKSGLVFLIGFDTLLVYDEPPAGAKLPFWKIYAQDGRVVFIILSSFGMSGELNFGEVGFPPSCFMMADPSGVVATFGPQHLLVKDDEHSHDTYHYLDRGISVIIVEGAIRVFDIYGPIDRERRARFRRALIAQKAPKTEPSP